MNIQPEKHTSKYARPINLYLIPGMGTDHRVFDDYQFNKSLAKPICIKWVDFLHAKSLEEYAGILANQIDTSQPFVLLGVSMGGMLALEIRKQYPTAGLILISSAIHPSELPARYKMGRIIPLYRFLTDGLLNLVANWKGFYRDVDKEEKKHLYKEMLKGTGGRFLKWQMDAIIHWQESKEELSSAKILRIHGSNDKVIPLKNIQSRIDFRIEKGTHKLAVNQFQKIGNLVNVFIEEEIG